MVPVLQLFRDRVPAGGIEHEARRARAVDPKQMRLWRAIAAAARLSESIRGRERWALSVAEKGLLG